MPKSEIEKFFSDDYDDMFSRNTQLIANDDWKEEASEGRLSIDIQENDGFVVIHAPMAGVKEDDIEVSLTEDMVSIKGKREIEKKEEGENYFIQECYWGSFSRSQSLPTQVISDKAEATLKNGLLTIKVPKASKAKGKFLKIKAV
jgi:HSP20 family protein